MLFYSTDGVVVIDSDYAKDKKVFAQAVLTYRYGREEDEVMGLTFAKEIIVSRSQVYPAETVPPDKLTFIQVSS